ncbi:MAG: DUF2089 family protein, partial [Caldisericaceae bacterium]
PSCGTSIHGNFQFDKLMLLDEEDMEFLMTFLRSRGNIKELETRMSISYPTAKSRLDKLLKSLDLYEGEENTELTKTEILQKLERGEITVEESLRLLKGGSKGE